ncbi:MAG: polysaccharide deacetylase family protein [Gemmatimonadota bacterium]|nr:polysaccharide deacetylase family protein [Gemmatimonadota bacterium]
MKTVRQPVILIYHRVTRLESDPHGIAVRPDRFRRQMELLVERRRPVTLSRAVDAVLDGTAEDGLAAVTFDDGYADNAGIALPVLEELGVPATVFAVSGSLGSGREFWWDELEALLLGSHPLPTGLRIRVGERNVAVTLPADEWSETVRRSTRGWSSRTPGSPPTARHGLYATLFDSLRGLSGEARGRALDELGRWAEWTPSTRETHRPLDAGGLARLAASGVVEIGAHTEHHPALSCLSRTRRWSEISDGRRRLEEMVGPVRHFAYPFGDSGGSRRLVRKAGFDAAFITTPKGARPPDRYRIPRTYVGDWDESEFARRILTSASA